MQKVREIILSISIAAFAMLAGAACYHQAVMAADKPVREVASVQPMEVTAYWDSAGYLHTGS